MKRLSRFEKTGIIALIVIFALFFYKEKIYKPQFKKFIKLRGERAGILSEIQSLRADGEYKSILSAVKQEQRRLQQAKMELKKAKSSLAKKGDSPRILTKINQIAADHSLKICSLNPVDEKEEFLLERNLYNLIIIGQFMDFKRFLKEVFNILYLITIEKLEIGRVVEKDVLEINLLISI